jgi:hypothetical protein
MRKDNEMLPYINKVGFGKIHKSIIERIKKQKAHYRLMKLKRNSVTTTVAIGGIAAGTTLNINDFCKEPLERARNIFKIKS